MTDTDLIARADAALDGVTPDRCYLIKKNCLYYRPNCKGYTTSATQAGRYTLDEAIKESHPNGPDGPRDGMTYQHENDARDDDWLVVRELRHLVPALRDALAAERARVVALEAERDKANAEWADAQSAATYNAEYVDLALEMRARVTALEAERDRLRAAIQAAIDCGMVPKSTAKNGGAPRHSEQVRVADMIRAALTGEPQP